MYTDEAALAAMEYTDHLGLDALPIDPLPAASPQRAQPEMRMFGFPGWIWKAMLGCYAVFFSGMLLTAGSDGGALMMIIISILYTLVYFGTAFAFTGVGLAQAGEQKSQWVDGKLQTIYGGLDMKSVAAQVLVVPAMIALFGISIAVIAATVS